MPGKLAAFLITLALLGTGLSSASESQCMALHDRMDIRVLQGVKIELEEAGTTRALVEMPSDGIAAVNTPDIAGAWFEGGQVWLSFYKDGALLKGRYKEPDLIRHFETNRSNLSSDGTDAAAAGGSIGLDRLRELIEGSAGTVTVAVIDTGVDIAHPWFQDRIVSPYDAVEDDNEPHDLFGHGTHIADCRAKYPGECQDHACQGVQ